MEGATGTGGTIPDMMEIVGETGQEWYLIVSVWQC